MRPRTAAIVPARDEAERIAATVAALREVAELDEVVVVDDGSRDRTAALAEQAGARVVRLERNVGKGGALRAGIAAVEADVLVFVDGDLAGSASVARALLGPVVDGTADMTIARPPASAPSGFGLVEGLARWGVRRLAGFVAARPLSGQRALRREIARRFPPAARFGVEVALTIDAVRAGYRVVEVEHAVAHARTGRDLRGFAHRARQGFDVAAVLAGRAFRRPGS